MQRNREENDMAINEIRGKIKTLINQRQANIGAEIDTDVECEPVGIIPYGG